MAKNQKHEKKDKVQNVDERNAHRAYEEELEKNKCASANAKSGAASLQSGDDKVNDVGITQEDQTGEVSLNEFVQTESSVTELSKEVEKWKNEYLRKAADFENYRKRMIKEKKDAIDYANESILQDLVNVLDDFDRGIDAVEKYATDAVKPYMQGFTMIRSTLYSTLESKYGLKCYKSEGEVFDPNIHDAKASRESEEVEVETVEKELLKGYKLHDRVIRVAQVETVKPKK